MKILQTASPEKLSEAANRTRKVPRALLWTGGVIVAVMSLFMGIAVLSEIPITAGFSPNVTALEAAEELIWHVMRLLILLMPVLYCACAAICIRFGYAKPERKLSLVCAGLGLFVPIVAAAGFFLLLAILYTTLVNDTPDSLIHIYAVLGALCIAAVQTAHIVLHRTCAKFAAAGKVGRTKLLRVILTAFTAVEILPAVLVAIYAIVWGASYVVENNNLLTLALVSALALPGITGVMLFACECEALGFCSNLAKTESEKATK